MDVHLRHLFFNRNEVLAVVVAGERVMDPSLHTDLGRAAVPCLLSAPSYLFW